jgi:two-component system response regulator AtoC
MSATVLLVDDDPHLCELLALRLRRHGFKTESCRSGAEALALLADGQWVADAAVTDIRLQGESGLDLCQRMRAQRPDMPVIVITGDSDADAAVGALRAGAFDFIRKPIDLAELTSTLDRALQQHRLEKKVHLLSRERADGASVPGILGTSPAMKEVRALIERVAGIDTSILISGENGTGKEMAARALHDLSPRRDRPFVAINCAAIPEGLVESELFGHARGAFTDARQDRKGIFVQAEGGTLLLDEIGELPVRMQAKLLRVLQERKVRPVGSEREIPIDVRFVSATNRNLTKAIAEGQFREDLYYRVSVIHVDLPPLRSREDDLLVLAQHFIERFAAQLSKPVIGLTTGAAEALMSYAWPGNVRELQNSIEHAVALTPYDRIRVDDLPERMRGYERRPSPAAPPAQVDTATESLEEMERRHIEHVLEQAGGNKSQAARLLGLSRRTLHRKFASGVLGETDKRRRAAGPQTSKE